MPNVGKRNAPVTMKEKCVLVQTIKNGYGNVMVMGVCMCICHHQLNLQ